MLSKAKTSFIFIAVMLFFALVVAGCGAPQEQEPPEGPETPEPVSLKIIGSNTITPLSAVWAEEFMKKYPRVSIAVSGPGSGAGIAALIDGTTDICQASRKIRAEEIAQAEAKGVQPYEIRIANDGLAVVVHPSNTVSELTIAQLSRIYTGNITNWAAVGGRDAPIVVLARDTTSGTHVVFKELVMRNAEYGSGVLFLPSTEAGIMQVAGNENAIFYAGLGYLTGQVKVLGIKKTDGDQAVLPSEATVLNGTYPISRPLFYYTNGAPTGMIKQFIDYCLSPEGQAKVREIGYVPVSG